MNAAIIIGVLMLLVLPACAAQITVTGITPSSGFNNDTIIAYLIGSNFSDKSDTYLQREGVTRIPTAKSNPNSTLLICSFNLNGLLAGSWNVTVFDTENLSNNATLVNRFTIYNPLPVLTNISPNYGYSNGTTTITFTGDRILTGATANITNGSYVVTGIQVGSTSAYTFNFAGLSAGNWNAYIKNTDGNQSNTRPFTLYNVPPVISSVYPLNSTNDQPNQGVIIYGSSFRTNPAVRFWKDGVPLIPISTGPTTPNQGQINLGLNLQNIPVGFYNVTVTNPGVLYNTTTALNKFQVFYPQAPDITDIQPNTGLNNAPINVTINGSGFYNGIIANLIQGSSTIPATNVLGGNGSGITCTFDLTGKPTGSYSLTVRNNDTQEDTLPDAFTVTAPIPPVANFTGTPRSGTATSLDVQFTDTSTGTGITSYQWIFSDSATIYTAQNLIHTFIPGTYNVYHSVTNSSGTTVWKNETGYIVVTAPVVPPVANFTGTPRSGTATSLNVQFTDSSTGTGITEYQWIFSDSPGVINTTQNPNHTFSPGTYNVYHSATNSAGTTWKNETGYIVVTAPVIPPVANFSASPTAGFKPLTVQFNDESVSGITEWKWTLVGDEFISTVKNPLFTYNEAGNYTVKLKVWNATGDDKVTKNNFIVVTNRPVADFSANPTSGTAPLSVTFTDNTPYATGWLWTFGDGTNSTQKNPVHNYTVVGMYDVTLRVFNAGGEGTPQLKTGYITVRNPCPVANFTATPTTGDINLTVQFTDTSTGPITSRNWDFGDSSPVSHDSNPVHTYTTVGLYTVQLKVLNPDCSDIMTKTNLINATQPKPIADFTGRPANGTAKETVFYGIDQSRNNPTSWLWNFGDGTTSTLQNPTHIYQTSGNWYITLTASNAGGTSAPFTRGPVIVRNPRAIANFTGTPTIGSLPLMVQFTDTSSNMPNRWAWEFGDGTFADTQNPVHTYNTAGSYTVYLRVNDTTAGQPYSDIRRTAYITVTKTPFAEFIASPTSGNTPLAVTFTDQSQGNPWRFSWKFGDGMVSSLKNPTHVYQRPGVYTVTETVQNMAGFNTTVKQNLITVTELPKASFIVNATTGIAPKSIKFTDTSTGVPDSWNWDFGDGSQHSAEKNPVHTYLSYGTYSVQLVVSNGAGSSDITKSSLISIGTPINADFTFMPAKGDVPLMIQFTDNSAGNPTGYKWQFGDGIMMTSTEQNPVHTYTKPGIYNVTLTITTTPGVFATVTKQIVLTGTPVASFKANPTAGSDPLTVQFTDTSSNKPTTWFWTYGDGQYGNERNPVHTYNSPGTYTVKLTATNKDGSDTATYTDWISVSKFP